MRLHTWSVRLWPVALLAFVGLHFASGGMLRTVTLTETIGYLVIALIFGTIVAVVVTSKPSDLAVRILSFRPLRGIGQISYAMYLLHYLIAAQITRFVFDPHQPLGNMSPFAEFVIFVSISAMLTVLAALASWNLYECHWLKLKRFFTSSSRLDAAQEPAYAQQPIGSLSSPLAG